MKSKYKVILDEIVTKVENATYRPGDMIPTEHDFAALYNVSRTTVQRALNILVSKGVIYRIAGKGTFVSDSQLPGQAAHSNGDKTFSLLLPNHSQESIQYARGAQAYLERMSYRLSTHFIEKHYENAISEVSALLDGGCPGIILYPASSEDRDGYFRQLALRDTPIVTIDKEISGSLLSSVASNNYMGAYSLAEYLISNGHTDFIYISNGRLNASTLADRYRGFTDCLRDKGIALGEDNVMTNIPYPDNEAVDVFKKYFAKHPRKTPFVAFCAHDRIASNVYHAAYELNLRIPETMSVVGFDNLEIAAMLCPSLTTVAQPFFEIGRNAAKILVRLHEKRDNTTQHMKLSTPLIIRNSVTVI